jgi:hypothetical protein
MLLETISIMMWTAHIEEPPEGELQPIFDFTRQFEKMGARTWNAGWMSYQLRVTASDLSKSVVLTYSNLPVLSVSKVRSGLPWSVRWRYIKRNARWKWQWLTDRFKNESKPMVRKPVAELKLPKVEIRPSSNPGKMRQDIQTSVSPEEKCNPPDTGPLSGL